jgi:hypothetical protein
VKLELTLIDAAIRQHDEIQKSIKNRAIAAWTAGIGVSLLSERLNDWLFLTALIPLLFWYVEALYRRLQRSFIFRTEEISERLNSPGFAQAAANGGPIPVDLMRLRVGYSSEMGPILQYMFFRTIGAHYIGLAAVSVACWSVVSPWSPLHSWVPQ